MEQIIIHHGAVVLLFFLPVVHRSINTWNGGSVHGEGDIHKFWDMNRFLTFGYN